MSTVVAVVLFVIGVGALILSAVLDRRAPARDGADRKVPSAGEEASVPEEPESIETGTDLAAEAEAPELEAEAVVVADVEAEEPEISGPESEVSAAEEQEAEPEAVSEDRAAAAEARLQRLRAELAGSMLAAEEAQPQEPSPEPAPVAETTASDARRVFAAVAAVGQAPAESEVVEPEPAEPEPAEPEGEPGVEGAIEASGPQAAIAAEGELEHQHAVPLVNHSDLVTHLRSQHPDLESSGSTIQMRLLHERWHAGANA